MDEAVVIGEAKPYLLLNGQDTGEPTDDYKKAAPD
jgi:hypothetical protein